MTPLITTTTTAAVGGGGGGGVVGGNETGAGTGKIILLIDSRTPRTSKKIIAEILERVGLEPGAAGIDCYDWRVVGHSDWKGERRLYLLAKEDGGQKGEEGEEGEKGGKKIDASSGGDGDKVVGKGESGSGRKVDWDLFYMVSV